MAGITLVGLGTGAPRQTSLEVQELLQTSPEIWVTSTAHPVIAGLPESTVVRVLGAEGGRPSSADPGVDSEVLAQVMSLSQRPEGVVIALPGHPLINSSLGQAVRRAATQAGISPKLVSGPSSLDAVISALPSDALQRLFLCSASSLARSHIPPFPPDAPALITGVGSIAARAVLLAVLQTAYPARHMVEFFSIDLDAPCLRLPLAELVRIESDGPDAWLYLPPLGAGTSLEALQEVVAHLRAPEGCPWDRKQTHASLRPHLLEESYEAMAAMDSGDASSLREELGDLLLQIMLNSQIAAEAGDFNLNDVTHGIHEKLIRRHPHVFGELELGDVDGVLSNWEKLKEAERAQKGKSSGLLEGAPAALPALSLAQEYQERAARVGFDWPQIDGVLEKIAEEIREVQAAVDTQALEAELGDLFFSLVNLSRWKGVDAEVSA